MKQVRREGKLLMDHGQFEARLRPPPANGVTPTFVVRYRIVTDPSNLELLKNITFTLLAKHSLVARVWESESRGSAGLSVNAAADVKKLCAMLFNQAVNHPRYLVVAAWEDCVYWTTSRVRERLAPGERYSAKLYTEQRREAAAALHAANNQHPPAPMTPGWESFNQVDYA